MEGETRSVDEARMRKPLLAVVSIAVSLREFGLHLHSAYAVVQGVGVEFDPSAGAAACLVAARTASRRLRQDRAETHIHRCAWIG